MPKTWDEWIIAAFLVAYVGLAGAFLFAPENETVQQIAHFLAGRPR